VAAWPAVTLVGSYELVMVIIRGVWVPAGVTAAAGLSGPPDADPLRVQATQVLADDSRPGRRSCVHRRVGVQERQDRPSRHVQRQRRPHVKDPPEWHCGRRHGDVSRA
jgi:hypothetical protein